MNLYPVQQMLRVMEAVIPEKIYFLLGTDCSSFQHTFIKQLLYTSQKHEYIKLLSTFEKLTDQRDCEAEPVDIRTSFPYMFPF